MKVIKFDYKKDDESSAKTYFVALYVNNSTYVEGYDLVEGKYKRFLQRNVVGSGTELGNLSEELVPDSRIISRTDLLRKLGYDSNVIAAIDSLGVSDIQIAKQYSKKTGEDVVVLSGYFVLCRRSQKIMVNLYDQQYVTMNVSRSGIRYFNEAGTELSSEQFIELVLKG